MVKFCDTMVKSYVMAISGQFGGDFDHKEVLPVRWGERVGEELGGVESSSRGVS